MRRSRARLVPLLVTLLASCAAPGTGGSARRDPDLILREEINRNTGSRTALELVQSLRPQWLITRGIANLAQATGIEDIVVYLDNARLGGPVSMRGIALGPVQYLRFFSAPQATQRWGAGHLHGAILISTQSRGRAAAVICRGSPRLSIGPRQVVC